MKVPLSWLQEYVPIRIPPVELAHRLTMAGIETIYVPGPSSKLGDILVGNVLDIERHPNADRLSLVTVDIKSETLRVVCGAPNVSMGLRVAVARVGTTLTDQKSGKDFTLKAASIRGIESNGMLCSEYELGLGDDHTGIIELPVNAPVGESLDQYLKDDVFDVEITANRGDCLSILGIAREIAAITELEVTEPESIYIESGPAIDSLVSIKITDASLCSRYAATVIENIAVGPSPQWMQANLIKAGLRPINNVVDVTNYVMLEYGQPLHAFDLSQVKQSTVIVRPASPKENLQTLDGVDHTLAPPMLLITDPERAIGLAGIMGGSNSEMTESTTNLLLESATFDSINIRRTAAALKLRTEASLRFEKKLNPELAIRAIKRATALILETAGGRAAHGISDTFSKEVSIQPIHFTHKRFKQVMGQDISHAEIEKVLSSLGFTHQPYSRGENACDDLLVTPPYWRTDVTIEEDLIEEIARIVGYDSIEDMPLSTAVSADLSQPVVALREEMKDLLVASGLQEIISYSLVSNLSLEDFQASNASLPNPLRVANPMSQEQEFLRTTLRGSVLKALSSALRQNFNTVKLFEAGRVYLSRKSDLPEEREMIFAALSGPRGESLWQQSEGYFDFRDAKGILQGIFSRLGIELSVRQGVDETFHPGRTAQLLANGQKVGMLGELHPLSRKKHGIDEANVICFEIDLSLLLPVVTLQERRYNPFSRYPVADRDLAIMVDEGIPADFIKQILESHALVNNVILFDEYSGNKLPEGKKSLAYRIELQSDEGTLSTEQVNSVVEFLVQRLESEAGALLRTQE